MYIFDISFDIFCNFTVSHVSNVISKTDMASRGVWELILRVPDCSNRTLIIEQKRVSEDLGKWGSLYLLHQGAHKCVLFNNVTGFCVVIYFISAKPQLNIIHC